MRINPFHAFLPALDGKVVDESLFTSFKDSFAQLSRSGQFRTLEQRGLFIYEIERPPRVFRGLIACVAMDDYLEGNIKRHEMTLLQKEQLQMELFEEQQAIIKPILVTYPADQGIQEWFETLVNGRGPVLEITIAPHMETHRLFFIHEEPKIAEVQSLFLNRLRNGYIADGHHRFAAASRLYASSPEKPFQQVMCAFFDTDDLDIHSYNRIISGLNGLSARDFLQRISRYCQVTPVAVPRAPGARHSMLLLLGEGYYDLRWRDELIRAYGDNPLLLDIQLLNENILADILGVEDVRKDPRIVYVEGPAGIGALQEGIREIGEGAAFMLYPIGFEHLAALCDEGVMLPPKSTWFEPRMKPGLIGCSLQASKIDRYA
ncbi:MAG: DUF1015 family protein [Saprospiraceae bacterium]